jgi:hypothetical protein
MSLLNWSGGKGFADILFGRDNDAENVRPGTTFRRVHEDELIETAEVESVRPDLYGIPHVKFKVNFSRRNRFSYDEGSRTLALQSFIDRYREEVPA